MDHHQSEYVALRETIRQRGTVRMLLVPFIFVGWAGTAVATAAVITVAVSTLVPLLVLVAGFEAIFALHMNVERIGRYLQVFHEADGGWEHVAMAFGRRFPATGPDPLFTQTFVFGISVNFLPVLLGFEYPIELAVVLIPHVLAVYRIRTARSAAARQRSDDLERFQAIRDAR
jgi:hypothetical protein